MVNEYATVRLGEASTLLLLSVPRLPYSRFSKLASVGTRRSDLLCSALSIGGLRLEFLTLPIVPYVPNAEILLSA